MEASVYGLIAQETNGLVGLRKALRTVPVILDLAQRMEELCPDAPLINFTNPAGLVTRAVHTHTKVRCYGLCNVPILLREVAAKASGREAAEISIDCYGLNHLSIAGRVMAGSRDVTQMASDDKRLKGADEDNYYWVTPKLMRLFQGMPNPYLKYYADTFGELNRQRETGLRGEKVLQAEAEALKVFAGSDDWYEYEKYIDQRGGSGYSGAALETLLGLSGREDTRVVLNVQNHTTFRFLREQCSIEIPVRFLGGSAVDEPGQVTGDWLPELMRKIDTYEHYLLKGIVEKNKSHVSRAAAAHPLIGPLTLELPELD
jgi:6-phospho-beta-glucosidase